MSTNLTTQNPMELLLSKDNPEVVRLFEENYIREQFKHYMALKVPVGDIVKFFHRAQVTDANPLLDQIYLVPRNTKIKVNGRDEYVTVGTIVFSYHFIESKAQASKEYEGYTEETGPGMYFNPETCEERKMLKSTISVKRKGHSYPYTAWYEEYVQTSSYGVTTAWKKPHLMLRKCAMAGALRAAFPEWLSGAYTNEEMGAFEKGDEAIEASFKANEEVIKHEKIEQRIEEKLQSTEDMDKILATVELIHADMAELTKGATIKVKGEAMAEHLGVKKFDELKTKTLEELQAKQKAIRAIIDEKNSRELASATNAANATKRNEKPSFNLNDGK